MGGRGQMDGRDLEVEHLEVELIMKNNCDSVHHNNPLSEPSHHANVAPMSLTSNNTTANCNPNAAIKQPACPKLTQNKRQLLYNNKGCLKCRIFFINHQSNNFLTGFPSGTDYKVRMQVDIDYAKHHAACPAVTAVGDVFETDSSDNVHPVVAVLGSAHNPVAYITSNASRIIKHDADEESVSSGNTSVSTPPPSVKPHVTPSELKAEGQSALPPFYIPHLFWNCKANSNRSDFPVKI